MVAPPGAAFHDPRTGLARSVGSQVDVHVPGREAHRDFTLILADDDAQIGANTMPYPEAVDGPALINYRSEPRPDDASAFSSRTHGDPRTPLLRAYVGDPTRVHVLGAPGSEQPHAFSLGGLSWSTDSMVWHSNLVSVAPISPWVGLDAAIEGGAGGTAGMVGDTWYGDLRRPFARAGMWGLMRTLPRDACAGDLRPLPGRACGKPGTVAPKPPPTPAVPPEPADPPGEPGTPPVEPPAPAPDADDPGDAAGDDVLRGLVVRRSLSLKRLRRRGLELWVTTPAAARTLEVELRRVREARPATRARFDVAASRTVRVRWRPRRAERRRLRAGRHVLTVDAGPSRLERVISLRRPSRLTRR